jgi:uncharacterized protein YkwD
VHPTSTIVVMALVVNATQPAPHIERAWAARRVAATRRFLGGAARQRDAPRMMRLGCVLALVLSVTLPARAQIDGCIDDPRLAEAAAALALDPSPAEGTLLALVHGAGSEAPRAHALSVAELETARVAEWIASLVARGETPLACGEARVGDHRVIVATPAAATLTIDGVHVSGQLSSGWHDPMLYAEDVSGEVHALELTAPTFSTTLPDDIEAIRVQVVARGPDGPRPVAERVLGAREADATGSSDPRARVAELRRAASAPAVRASRMFDRIASAHAASICEAGEAAHELEPGRDPSERLREEGVVARHVGEVAARGVDVASALAALSRSPSHRAALVDRRFTDVGVGTAEGADGHHCVVVILTAWPRIVARAAHADTITP